MQLRGSVIHKPARVPLSVLVTYAIKTLLLEEIHGLHFGAIHVYEGRPSSSGSSSITSTLGLKVWWDSLPKTRQDCGRNYCCCYASYNAEN